MEDFLKCLNLLLSPLKNSQKWLMGLFESTHILNYPWNKSSPHYPHVGALRKHPALIHSDQITPIPSNT